MQINKQSRVGAREGANDAILGRLLREIYPSKVTFKNIQVKRVRESSGY
jgi:hypothetical protein